MNTKIKNFCLHGLCGLLKGPILFFISFCLSTPLPRLLEISSWLVIYEKMVFEIWRNEG